MAGKHDHMKFGVNDTFSTLNLYVHFKLVLKQCVTNNYVSSCTSNSYLLALLVLLLRTKISRM